VKIDALQVNVHDVAGGGGRGGPVEVFGPQTRFIAGAYEAGEGLLKRFVSKLSYVLATF
jgi:hypothetical protein